MPDKSNNVPFNNQVYSAVGPESSRLAWASNRTESFSTAVDVDWGFHYKNIFLLFYNFLTNINEILTMVKSKQ